MMAYRGRLVSHAGRPQNHASTSSACRLSECWS